MRTQGGTQDVSFPGWISDRPAAVSHSSIRDVKKELRSKWSAVVLLKDHNLADKILQTQTTSTQNESREFGSNGTTVSLC